MKFFYLFLVVFIKNTFCFFVRNRIRHERSEIYYETMEKIEVKFGNYKDFAFKGEASIYKVGNSLFLKEFFDGKIPENAVFCASINYQNSLAQIG